MVAEFMHHYGSVIQENVISAYNLFLGMCNRTVVVDICNLTRNISLSRISHCAAVNTSNHPKVILLDILWQG